MTCGRPCRPGLVLIGDQLGIYRAMADGTRVSGASTLICTPSSLAHPGQAAIGTRARPARITAVLHQAGFRTVRIAAETPVNHVYEARD